MNQKRDNPNFIPMMHGNLAINVPRKLFIGNTSTINEAEVKEFLDMLSSRYPWLTKDALKVILKEAQEAMKEYSENRKSTVQKARDLMVRNEHKKALRLLEKHLITNEDDADAWYAVGETLCKLGRTEEGFRAMARARQLAK